MQWRLPEIKLFSSRSSVTFHCRSQRSHLSLRISQQRLIQFITPSSWTDFLYLASRAHSGFRSSLCGAHPQSPLLVLNPFPALPRRQGLRLRVGGRPTQGCFVPSDPSTSGLKQPLLLALLFSPKFKKKEESERSRL